MTKGKMVVQTSNTLRIDKSKSRRNPISANSQCPLELFRSVCKAKELLVSSI